MEEPYYVKESHTQYHPNKGGASFLQTTPLGDSEPPQRVKWGVGWRSPTTVIALFLIGTITAIGHHYYYQSLDGKEVKLRFGTAFAFLAKTMFAAAVGVAYSQHLWMTVRKKSMTISGLDAMFGAVNDISAFLTLDFVKQAKLGAFLALLVWLIPLSALITPATLTVVPSTVTSYQLMTIPSINFSNIDPLYSDAGSNVQTDEISSDNGVTPYLSRLMSFVASSANLLSMPALPSTSSSYSYAMTFNGPLFQCQTPTQDVHTMLIQILNATSHYIGAAQFWYMTAPFTTDIAWLAFAPDQPMLFPNEVANASSSLYQTIVLLCIPGQNQYAAGSFAPDIDSAVQCEGISNVPASNGTLKVGENNGQIWVWAQNDTYNCVLTDTEYVVFFNSSGNGIQTIEPSYNYTWGKPQYNRSYYAIGNAMVNYLTGVVRGTYTGLQTYKMRMHESALLGALQMYNQTYTVDQMEYWGVQQGMITPKATALARNKSIGSLFEELSRNLTLGLFTADLVLNQNTTTTLVTFTTSVNVYAYSYLNLLLTYAATLILSLFGVIVGTFAFINNGVSHGTSFSANLTTTRNRQLDAITKGESLGTKPLSEDLERMRLRFGLLENGDSGGVVGGRKGRGRAGFGLPGEVDPLRKGADCE